MKRFPYTLNPEEIPTKKILKVAGESAGTVMYACPDALWREHFDAWCKLRRRDENGPEPMPYGHCMFSSPTSYGAVPYGCTDPAIIRKAHEHSVRASLDGWDRDIPKDKLDAIVKATVDARMNGTDVGAMPFVACIYASL